MDVLISSVGRAYACFPYMGFILFCAILCSTFVVFFRWIQQKRVLC